MNQKNALRIQKYLDQCLGPKRMISYDIAGLYTQQQLKNMEKDRIEKVKSKMVDIKQLKG